MRRAFPIVLLLLLAPSARAGLSEARELLNEAIGMMASEKAEQLARAEQKIDQALQEEKEPKRGNLFREDYFPYFYLGKVRQLRGDCRGALEAWKTSLEYDAVDDEERGELLRRQGECKALVESVAEAKQKADVALERADLLRASVERLGRQEVLRAEWATGSSSFASRLRAASERLGTVRQNLSASDARLDIDGVTAAERQAGEVLGRLQALEADVKARRGELDRERASALEALEEVEDRTERTLRWASRLDPYPPEAEAAVAAVRETLEEMRSRRDVADPEELAEMTQNLDAARGRLAARVASPPEALVEAGQAFLAGEYNQAITVLVTAETSFRDARAKFHARLLLAASRHALWALGGGSDDLLLSQAEEAIREAAVLDVPESTGVSERFFPPSFRAFFERVSSEARRLAETAGGPPDESPADS